MSSLLLRNADCIVSCDAEDHVYQHADLLMEDGVITAVGSAEQQADEIIDASGCIVYPGLETIGNTGGITIAGFDRDAKEHETSGAILADALGSTTAALFNALPNTAFGQNAGIVSMTKVVNK